MSLTDYLNADFLLLWAAALCAITALAHSVLGEMQLIRPLLADAQGVLAVPQARQVVRFAWHWTSALWLLVGGVLVMAVHGDGVSWWLLLAIGLCHGAFGILDLVLTRGRHVGWPLITLIGALTLLATYSSL